MFAKLLTLPYKVAVCSRLWLYEHGWISSKRLPCSVVSVGNLTAGGTGNKSLKLSFLNKPNLSLNVFVLLANNKVLANFLERPIGGTDDESAPPAIPTSIFPAIIDSAILTVD